MITICQNAIVMQVRMLGDTYQIYFTAMAYMYTHMSLEGRRVGVVGGRGGRG